MNTLVYSSWFGDLGGGELRMLDHIVHSRIHKDQIAVIVQSDGALASALTTQRVKSYIIRWKGGHGRISRQFYWYRGMYRCGRVLRKLDSPVVFCNTFHDLETTGRVAARLKLPLVWRARADTFTNVHRWPSIRLFELVRFLNSNVARILATTEYEADLMRKAGVSTTKIRVIHNGVDLRRFDDPESGKRLRGQLGLSEDVAVIGFAARMVPQKGFEVFLASLAQLKQSNRRFKAIIAGGPTLSDDGNLYKERIESMVHHLGLRSDVLFLGERRDVHAVMNASDVFVLASFKEPFGTTVIEAMAAGKPVIASDLPGPRESIVSGETGLFFPAGDAQALTDCLIRLLSGPEDRREMGIRGRLRVRELFSMDAYVSAMDGECQALMNAAMNREITDQALRHRA